MRLELPLPPSLNHYYRSVRGIVVISAEGKQYRKTVETELVVLRLAGKIGPAFEGPLAMHVEACGAALDKNGKCMGVKRDIDNTLKALLDALQHAGAYVNDGQIDDLHIVRGPACDKGKVIVTIREL